MYNKTLFVYFAIESINSCCQQPAAWLTQPHDAGGVRIGPLPFPHTTTSWASACNFDDRVIPHDAAFTNGTCKDAGYSKMGGSCMDQKDCDCGTSWFKP